MNLRRFHPELIVLIVAGFATRLWSVFKPGDVVFDEVYFKAFAAHYLDGHYYFDIHPPLGKLLLAGFAWTLHLTPAALLSSSVVTLRLLPAVAGALLIPLIWGILRRLGASRPFAALGAAAILLDNALLVESRFILMDSLLLLFGLGAVYFWLVARTAAPRKRWLLLTLAALGAGAAASIKWTGLGALGLILLIWLLDQRGRHAHFARRAGEFLVLTLIPAALYVSVFALHFALLPSTGDGDAFMSRRFQSTLQGSPYANSGEHLSFVDKITELNVEMYHANQTLTATHPYGSRWYSWPLELRPIYYWEGTTSPDNKQGNIYLLGNPVIWWGLWIALLWGVIVYKVRRHILTPRTVQSLALLGCAYLINLVPFVAVPRVMFLYHYFFSFIFSLMFVVILWNDLASPDRALARPSHRRAYLTVLALIALGFAFFSPLSYGWPLSPAGLAAHMWLPSWR